jgi:hypothetical protein
MGPVVLIGRRLGACGPARTCAWREALSRKFRSEWGRWCSQANGWVDEDLPLKWREAFCAIFAFQISHFKSEWGRWCSQADGWVDEDLPLRYQFLARGGWAQKEREQTLVGADIDDEATVSRDHDLVV